MTVTLSGSRSRSIIISQIPAMEHYQGVSETTGTSGTVSVGILANPVYEGTYKLYLEQTMRDAGVKTSHTHSVYGGLYYTFDSGLESGLYRVAAVFHGKYGSWKVTSGTSNSGTTLESGTITYAPTGSVSYAPYRVV